MVCECFSGTRILFSVLLLVSYKNLGRPNNIFRVCLFEAAPLFVVLMAIQTRIQLLRVLLLARQPVAFFSAAHSNSQGSQRQLANFCLWVLRECGNEPFWDFPLQRTPPVGWFILGSFHFSFPALAPRRSHGERALA